MAKAKKRSRRVVRRKGRRKAKGQCGCPAGMSLLAKNPVTGKKYKRPTCATVIYTKRGDKVRSAAPRCLPKGYEITALRLDGLKRGKRRRRRG